MTRPRGRLGLSSPPGRPASASTFGSSPFPAQPLPGTRDGDGLAPIPPLRTALLGEVVETFLLVLFGTGAVATAVLTGALVGPWQVAVVWGFGVTLAIYATAGASGAHLNPAVTLALALLRPGVFPRQRLLPYWAAQLGGAVLAGLAVLLTFAPFLARFETERQIARGAAGSELSAMVFGQYFPNPALFGTGPAAEALVTPLEAFLVEGFGAALLVFLIFALTDEDNPASPPRRLAPFFIGFGVAVLISIFAPLTQGGWNPARDLGPRLVAFAAGWGSIALPGPRDGFWVYVAGPLVLGPLGGLLYDRCFGSAYRAEAAPANVPLPRGRRRDEDGD